MTVKIKIPNDNTLLNLIQSHYKDVNNIRLCKKSSTNKVFENDVWKCYYQRDFKMNLKNNKKINASIRLIQVGDKYVMNDFFIK